MKILWLCNIALPKIAKQLLKAINNNGGWLVSLCDDLSSLDNIELSICFPVLSERNIIKGRIDNIDYYGFPQKKSNIFIEDKNLNLRLQYIIKEVEPDIVHIFGTEFAHSLSMFKVFNNPEKTIISIQGLCSIFYKHFSTGIPFKIRNKSTFKEFIKMQNISKQRDTFRKRGELEIELIKKSKNIIGRTTLDKASVYQINQEAKYYFCNETLRNEFYKNVWHLDKCERYSIFVSQGNYPIKGLHFMIEAMTLIIKEFPNTHLYVGGLNIIKNNDIKDKLKLSSYAKYILQLLYKYNLLDYVSFTGDLNEEEMCKRFLKANVFVCPSTIENSPNSLGEAMLLGVPSVASYVGGIPDMLEDKKEGFLYQGDAPYMLAHYVCKIFEDNDLALKFSENSKKRALITHNRKINLETMLKIYENIY